jgi:hypothetical protein
MRRHTVIGLVIGLTVIGVLFRFSVMTFTLYALAAAYIISVFLSRSALDGLSCARTINKDRAEIGESLEIRAIVSNSRPLPLLWVLVEEVLPQRLTRTGEFVRLFVMPPHARRQLDYRVTFTCRGYHQIGPVILESGDLFGFMRSIRVARSAHYITVRPVPEAILRYDVATHRPIGEIRVRRQIYEDPTRIAGVRPYEVGDPLNRIHWKTTARTGVLHSRVYEATVLAGATVVLDFHRPAYNEADPFDRSELACVAAASIVCYLIEVKETAGLLSNGLDAAERVKGEGGLEVSASRGEARRRAAERVGEDRLRSVQVRAGRGAAKAAEMLDALARLELSDGMALDRMLREEAPGLSRELALIIITPSLGRSLMQSVVRLRFWGFTVTVMLIDNQPHYDTVAGALEAEHVRVLHVRSREELHQIARSGI